ncbi:MAG: polymerase subunit beta [Gaiellaceae bacterium]|jgi:DNA polymerase-3 subunit beta|nr:polymerase subunit beta [Gaiellaceae bacterium]MDX6472171.1 polymerase subunit beta [Gaiellaceae bacterium]
MIETEETAGSSVGSGLKISCSKDALVQALGVVSRAVSTRTSVQILSGILLEPHESGLRVAATDMELSLRATLPAQLEGDGAIVLPGKTLADIARLLPSDEVLIEHKPAESVVHITSGTASYTLNTYNPEDFPRLPELDAVTTFAVDREPLLETILRVARAASRDESRPVLTGILVQFTGGTLVMAATDSYRLAVKQTALEGTVPELEAIVPARALQELARIASSGDEVEVGVHENQVIFATSGVWLTTRRIDGQFPNYKQLLPEAFEYELTVPRIELLEVVKRASVMIQRSTPLQIRFAEGELTVIARTHEVGESQESMPVAFTGDTLEMGFNADFLRDGLESLEGDDVRVKLISPLRPAVIQGDGDDFTYLVMPIRLPG